MLALALQSHRPHRHCRDIAEGVRGAASHLPMERRILTIRIESLSRLRMARKYWPAAEWTHESLATAWECNLAAAEILLCELGKYCRACSTGVTRDFIGGAPPVQAHPLPNLKPP